MSLGGIQSDQRTGLDKKERYTPKEKSQDKKPVPAKKPSLTSGHEVTSKFNSEYTKPSSSSTKLSYFQIPDSHLLKQVLVKVTNIYRPGTLQVVFSKKYSFPNITLIIAGVKLEETFGNSNGYYEGTRYFECDCNHAIFVSLEEESLTSRRANSKL